VWRRHADPERAALEHHELALGLDPPRPARTRLRAKLRARGDGCRWRSVGRRHRSPPEQEEDDHQRRHRQRKPAERPRSPAPIVDERAIERREQSGAVTPDVQLVGVGGGARAQRLRQVFQGARLARASRARREVAFEVAALGADEAPVAQRFDLEQTGAGAGLHDTSSSSWRSWRSSRRAACKRVHTVPIGIPGRSRQPGVRCRRPLPRRRHHRASRGGCGQA
jgi:hypothetical protein